MSCVLWKRDAGSPAALSLFIKVVRALKALALETSPTVPNALERTRGLVYAGVTLFSPAHKTIREENQLVRVCLFL
jgi:hypothetical protein